MDAICNVIRNVQLGRELKSCSRHQHGADLKMDMDGSDRIPARIDRQEPGVAPGIGHLIASQELLAHRVEARIPNIRIDPCRIAVPHIDLCVRQWPALAAIETQNLEGQRQRHARPDLPVGWIGANVRPL